MDNFKIYFAGAIRGGKSDACIYKEIISHINKKHGTVLTEHVGDTDAEKKEKQARMSDLQIYNRDLEYLTECKAVVAETTITSTGVGYELGRIIERNCWMPEIPVLCLHRNEHETLSAMVSGCPNLILIKYNSIDEAKQHIDIFFRWVKN